MKLLLSVRRIDQAAEIGTSKHPNWDQLAVAVGRQQLATNERLYIAVIDMSLTQQHLGKLVKPSVREANRYRCYFMVDYAKMFFFRHLGHNDPPPSKISSCSSGIAF